MNYARLMAVASAGLLCACASGTVKNTLGLERKPPDEFRVVTRPPLSVPPQFTLRPPSATDESPNALSAHKQAESLLLGNGAGSEGNTFSLKDDQPVAAPAKSKKQAAKPAAYGASGATAAETAFLKDAGADKADATVRSKLAEEKIVVQDKQEEDDGGSSWWDIFSNPKKEPVVDAKKEAARIRTDKDTGQPVTTGATPDVKQKDTGLLGRIFGY